MHHLKLLRSGLVRSAMSPVVLLCLMVLGCSDQEPTVPVLESVVRRTQTVPFHRFFIAWSQNYSSSPVATQVFALDTRQDRQFAPFEVNTGVLAFARANPGR